MTTFSEHTHRNTLASYKNCCSCVLSLISAFWGWLALAAALDRSWQVGTCGCHGCGDWTVPGMRPWEAGLVFVHRQPSCLHRLWSASKPAAPHPLTLGSTLVTVTGWTASCEGYYFHLSNGWFHWRALQTPIRVSLDKNPKYPTRSWNQEMCPSSQSEHLLLCFRGWCILCLSTCLDVLRSKLCVW